MYSYRDLYNDLQRMNFAHDDTVLIHSSLKSIGSVDGGAETVLKVLMDYFGKEGLLILPTHTWATVTNENNFFDYENEPSCVGVLSNIFMKLPGVTRSIHPTHSVAAYGKNADQYVANDMNQTTPCGRNSSLGKLIDCNGKILFLGCPLSKNTFIHGVEEWNNIPNRLSEDYFEYKIKMDGKLSSIKCKRHQAPIEDVSANYIKLEEPMLKEQIAFEGKFGDARCVIADAAKMNIFVSKLLKNDNDLFLDDKKVPKNI